MTFTRVGGTVVLMWALTLLTGLLITNYGRPAILLAWGTLTFPVWLIGYRMGEADERAKQSTKETT